MSTQSQTGRFDAINADERDESDNEVTSTRPALVTPPDRESDADERRATNRPERTEVEHETPYLAEQTSTETNERWRQIQSEFVDDPRKSVAEAHKLVSDVVQRIVDSFAEERNDLERQWSKGDSVSTEDLRVSLQRYRAFFSRLLPSMNGLGTPRH
jgi:hypothetical protein